MNRLSIALPENITNNRKTIFELSPIRMDAANFDKINNNDQSPEKSSMNYLSRTQKGIKEENLDFEDFEKISIDDRQQHTIFERLMKIEVKEFLDNRFILF